METNEILQKIYELLAGQNKSESWRPIDNGRQQSSYKEFSITIAPNGIYVLNNPFNYFRCLDANQNFKIAWSTNNGQTDFSAGLGIKFEQVIPYAQIFNPSSAPLVISVGVGIGYFDDSRLNVTGTLRTSPAQYQFFTAETLTFDSSGTLDIAPAQKLIIQNTGGDVIYIGGTGTDGLQLQPQGSFELSFSEDLTIYGTDGETVAVGSFS